jgi:hypothetical protein
MLNINRKLEDVLKILKIISGSTHGPDIFKQAKTGHLISGMTVPLNQYNLIVTESIKKLADPV